VRAVRLGTGLWCAGVRRTEGFRGDAQFANCSCTSAFGKWRARAESAGSHRCVGDGRHFVVVDLTPDDIAVVHPAIAAIGEVSRAR
jgi:hypothetical protein